MSRRSSRNVKNAVGNISGDIPAKLVAPLKTDVAKTAAQEDESGLEDEGWDEDEGTDKKSEDEDSDYVTKRQSTPAKKKAKTRHSAASKRRKSLSLLLTMPLDILFEIFSHLSPKDIIHVSRTSKTFHETLSSRNSMVVWKAARERGSIPVGPDWMSEAAWADLVFEHTCQSCGTKGVHKVDFLLLKRICISCKKTHYVLRSKVEKRYPDADFVILDLVPSTNISAWSSWARSSYYYWDHDLELMISKLAALRDEANSQELIIFMDEQKRRQQYIREHSTSWHNWFEKMKLDRSQEAKRADDRRLHQIQDRFKELGYESGDLVELRYREQCRGKTQVTDKVWNRLRPILEPDVKERKAQRIEREIESIKRARRRILSAQYQDFQRTLHPSRWRYLPRTLEISAFEPFARHLEADVDVEVDQTTFVDAFLELPSLLVAATEQRKTTLRGLMDVSPREDGEDGPDPLDLATSVFQCAENHSHYVFGWDDIATHHCLSGLDNWEFYPSSSNVKVAPVGLKYSPKVANIVRKMAQLIGLDPATATAADFDEKNLRFSCDSCIWFKQSGQYYRLGYSWRTLAVHLEVESHNPDLLITVLSDDSANEVKECERFDRKWLNLWTCSHCPEYLDKPRNRDVVTTHLSDLHGIQTPSEPTDYFFFERYRRDLSSKPKFLIPEPKNLPPAPKIHNLNKNVTGKFRCLLCLTNTNRLFILKGVEDHLRAKHSISVGEKGVHYVST